MAHTPFYYGLLHFWILVGDSESWLRALSAIAGTTLVGVVHRVGVGLHGRSYAALAAFVVATSPMQIWASREVRPYILMDLGAVVALYAWLRALRTDCWRDWFLFAVGSAVAIYSHYYGAFIVAALGIAFLLLRRPLTPSTVKRVIAAHLLLFVLFAPWLTTFYAQYQGLREYAGEVRSFSTAEAGFAKSTLYLLSHSDPAHALGGALEVLLDVPSMTWVSLLIAIVIFYGAHRYFIAADARWEENFWLIVVGSLLLIPNILHRTNNLFLSVNYFTLVSVGLSFLGAAAILSIRSTRGRRIAIVLVALLQGVRIANLYQTPESQLREAVAYMDSRIDDGEVVFTISNKAFCYRFYTHKPHPVFDVPSEVPGIERSTGMTEASLSQRTIKADDLPAILKLSDRYRATWLMINETQVWGVDIGLSELQRSLRKAGLRLQERKEFSDTVVERYAR